MTWLPCDSPVGDRRVAFILYLLYFMSFFIPAQAAFGTEPKASSLGTPSLAAIPEQTWSTLPERDLNREGLEQAVGKFIGIPYRMGGESPKGMDCSGLIKQIYSRLFGIKMPHNSSQQSTLPFLKKISKDDLRAGDLIFFGAAKNRINHVGMYLSDGRFIHAISKTGVTISSLNSHYWRSRFIVSKRVQGLQSRIDVAADSGNSNPFRWAAPSIFSDSMVPTLDLGYEQRFFDDLLELEISALLHMAPPEDRKWEGLFFSRAKDQLALDDLENWDIAQGLQVSATIAPFDWLRVTPSLSYLDMPGDRPGPASSIKVVGLESTLALPQTRWSLFMSAGATTQENLLEWRAMSSTDWKSFGVTFGFGYRLMDSLSLSVLGSHEWEKDSSLDDNRLIWDQDMDNFSFKLDFRF